jgi:hypothetical protein
MSAGFRDFSFGKGDKDIGKKSKRYKGEKGNTDRVSFVWFEDDEDGNPQVDGDIQFTGCERHYIAGVGYFLSKGPEYVRLAGGPPKQTVATIVCVWPTNKAGKLDEEAFAKGEGWEVKPWVFSGDRYETLATRHEDFPLNEYDLALKCKDTQYQKMDISPKKESLFRKLLASKNKKAQAIAANIIAEAKTVAATIRTDMARDLSLDQIREKMGGGSAGPVSGGAAEDVEGLVDNLLDEDDE